MECMGLRSYLGRNSVTILAVSALVAACTGAPVRKTSEAIPPKLIPPGFTARDCHVDQVASVDTDGSSKVATQAHGPHVSCKKHQEGATVVKRTPVCHTQSGTPLPLSDCCLTDTGDSIPGCTPKAHPATE